MVLKVLRAPNPRFSGEKEQKSRNSLRRDIKTRRFENPGIAGLPEMSKC
jgi:hypothetical protein